MPSIGTFFHDGNTHVNYHPKKKADTDMLLWFEMDNSKCYAGDSSISSLCGNIKGSLIANPVFDMGNGGELNLDGSTQYILLSESVLLPSTFTIATWLNISTYVNKISLLGNSGTNNDIEITRNSVEFNPLVGSEANFTNASGIAFATAGIWYHMALVRDSSNLLQLYINGVKLNFAGSTAPNVGATFNFNTLFKFQGGRNLPGLFGSMKIWSRTLSFSEASQEFNDSQGKFKI